MLIERDRLAIVIGLERERSERARPEVVFDKEDFLERCDGDERLVARMAALFLKSCPGWMKELRQAVAKHDGRAVDQAAHALLGAAKNLGAHAVARAALALEQMGSAGRLSGSRRALAALENEMTRLKRALSPFRKASAA